MMIPANDSVQSLLNSIQVGVQDAFSPLEASIRKAAQDFECSWLNSKKLDDELQLFGQIKEGFGAGKANKNGKLGTYGAKRNGSQCAVHADRKKGFMIKVPIKRFLGMFSPSSRSKVHSDDVRKRSARVGDLGKEDSSCVNCFQFAMTCLLLPNGFSHSLPSPVKGIKQQSQKLDDEKVCCSSTEDTPGSTVMYETKDKGLEKGQCLFPCKSNAEYKEKHTSLEPLIGLLFDQLSQNLLMLDNTVIENDKGGFGPLVPSFFNFNHLKAVASILERKKAEASGVLRNLNFAKIGGVPSSASEFSTPTKEEGNEGSRAKAQDGSRGILPQKVTELLSVPLSNVEHIRSIISTLSITELAQLVPQLGRSVRHVPDKKELNSVHDFFKYSKAEVDASFLLQGGTSFESIFVDAIGGGRVERCGANTRTCRPQPLTLWDKGKKFFEELDRDGDGQVTLEDLEIAIRRRNLPRRYARDLMQRARDNLFSRSFGWKQFLNLMEQREATILRAYTSLCFSKSGTLQKSEILASLRNAGLPANEEHAVAVMRFLNADTEGSISYGHFQNFMLLLPSDRLQDDPRTVWFEAATVVAVPPPVELPATSVLRAALAGGLSCALSTSLLHPVDSIKTRVQASALSFPEIISQLPQIGVRALYRGSIPAILGQFTSHGLRTGIFEATKLVLINVAPTLPDIQVQSIATFCSTLLGTATRIPNEVLKQRLQAGLFENVGEAIVGTWEQDGLKGFFRGTGATLCREVPFYVAGMGLYAEAKKLAQRLLGRELEPLETIAVGALSGGLAAVVTTPFDVLKTRMMTAPSGQAVSTTAIAFAILRHEGPLGLFKGAVPRFFWIAPLGAMNFAGYELAKQAMNKSEEPSGDQKQTASSE